MTFDGRVGGSGRKPMVRTDSSTDLDSIEETKTKKSEKSEKSEKKSSKRTDESQYTTGRKGSLDSPGSETDVISGEEKSRKPEKKKGGFSLFKKKKKHSSKTDTKVQTTQTAPPQDNWWDKPPTAVLKNRTDLNNYLDQHLPMPQFQRDDSLSKLENLQRLNSMDSPFLVMARGAIRMGLENSLNNGGEVRRFSDPVPEKEIESAKGAKYQGACEYVASELARFLGDGAMATRLISLRGGNHSFVHTSDENGGRVVVDPSWRQFVGELGITHSLDELPSILVGTPDQIKTYLEGICGTSERNVEFRDKLVGIYTNAF